MKSFYRDTVAKAWKLALNQRWLWPLAFFASFLGLSTTFKIFFDLAPSNQSLVVTVNDTISSDFFTTNFVGWSQGFYRIPWSNIDLSTAPLLALILLVFVVFIALIIMVVSSEAGLISGVSSVLNNKKTSMFNCLQLGLNKFWQLFIVHFFYSLLYIVFLGIIILPVATLVDQMSAPVRLLSSIGIYLIIVPTIVVLDIMVRYTVTFITLRKATVQSALKQAYDLFKANWLISLETALMVMVLLLVYTFIVIQILNLLFYLFIFFAGLMPAGTLPFYVTLFTGLAIMTAIVVTSFVIFTTFYLAIWTGMFERLEREVHYSKIHRAVRFAPWLHKRIV
jgi:hypothetical protein